MGKKPKPTIVSPEHTRRTNSFIDLASSDEESVNSDQPEENFLPNSTVNDSTVNKQPTADCNDNEMEDTTTQRRWPRTQISPRSGSRI